MVPLKSGMDLIAYAKTRPGVLSCASGASGATGSSTHLAAELFNFVAGVNIVHLTYKGTEPALNAVMASQV